VKEIVVIQDKIIVNAITRPTCGLRVGFKTARSRDPMGRAKLLLSRFCHAQQVGACAREPRFSSKPRFDVDSAPGSVPGFSVPRAGVKT